MKNILRTVALTAMIATTTAWTSAHAETPAKDMEMATQFMATAQAFVQSAIGADGNVQVTVNGDTATLIGFVNNLSTKSKAERAALKDPRVTEVRNHIVASN